MKRAQPEVVKIPGLDAAKAKRYSRTKLVVLLLSTLAGLIVAAALAFGREYLDRSIYDSRTLQNEFELPVLAEIPRIATR